MSFVHLHTHSEYSMLDGAARVKKLVAQAKAFEMPALAITDHALDLPFRAPRSQCS